MSFKKKMKAFWKTVWECCKRSFASTFMYFCAGTILLMLTMDEDTVGMDGKRWAWTIVCIVASIAYNAFVTYVTGGDQYEMLVSGNMKRVSAASLDGGYKISSHKAEKEYRPWKGFAIGAFLAIPAVLAAIVFGVNQELIDGAATDQGTLSKGLAIAVIVFFCLAGWAILPFYYSNIAGAGISYFYSLFLALIPIIVTGVMYIAGAYGRRNKRIRAQELADREMARREEKPKKINYGGLPGTKPRKRK